MKCALISYTGFGNPDPLYAARLLVFTKSTRLKMTPEGVGDVFHKWPEERIKSELAYMANTIRSSWEFVDYVFLLTDVTRAFTHQLVRHRHASFAQQTQQVLEVDASSVEPAKNISPNMRRLWDETVAKINDTYKLICMSGAERAVEQARGLLPTNIHTNIVVKMNLRTLVDFLHQRISPRNLGEASEVAKAMRDAVLVVHPWTEVFLNSTRDKAMAELDREIQEMILSGGYEKPDEVKNRMLKLVDQLRREG